VIVTSEKWLLQMFDFQYVDNFYFKSLHF